MSLDEVFSPQLGKPTVFGDLDVISETVPCGYMQPTKASIAARQNKIAKEAAAMATFNEDKSQLARRKYATQSRNSELGGSASTSPLKRPMTTQSTQ